MKAPLFLVTIFALVYSSIVVSASPIAKADKLTINERTIDIGAWLLANVTPLVTKLPPGILPNGSPCIPQWTVDYFLCQGGWCEPTVCINVLGMFWIHTYDVKGFCTSRPPDGQACVDKAPQIMDYNGPYPNIIDKD